MKKSIESKFEGTVNGVKFDKELIFNSVVEVIETIEEDRDVEIVTEETTRQIKNDIELAWMNGASIADIEEGASDFYEHATFSEFTMSTDETPLTVTNVENETFVVDRAFVIQEMTWVTTEDKNKSVFDEIVSDELVESNKEKIAQLWNKAYGAENSEAAREELNDLYWALIDTLNAEFPNKLSI